MTWPTVPLSEVAEVRLGRQRAPKNHRGDSMRPYIRAANVTWKGLSLTDVKTMNFTETEMVTYRMEPGDIVLSEASGSPGEVGKPSLWAGEIADCAFQNTLIRIRPWKHEPKFLLHYFRFQALAGRFVEHSRGVGIHHVGRSRLASWPTPLPPVDEQRRIVDLLEDHLSRLDAADRTVENSYRRLDRLIDAVLAEAVDDARSDPRVRLHSLGDLARVSTGTTPLRGNKAFHENGTIPWVTSGDLHQGLITRVSHLVTERALSETSLRLIPPGSLLIAMYGEGRTRGTVAELAVEATTNQACAAVQLHDSSLRAWVRLVLEANYNGMRRMAAGGVQPNLNLSLVRSIEIPVLSGAVADRALARVTEVSAARKQLGKSLLAASNRATALRRSLLAAAFAGRLTGSASDLSVAEEMIGA